MNTNDPFNLPLLETIKKEKGVTKKSQLVCSCFSVYEEDIEKLYRGGEVSSIDDVKRKTKAGTKCTNCIPKIKLVLTKLREGEL